MINLEEEYRFIFKKLKEIEDNEDKILFLDDLETENPLVIPFIRKKFNLNFSLIDQENIILNLTESSLDNVISFLKKEEIELILDEEIVIDTIQNFNYEKSILYIKMCLEGIVDVHEIYLCPTDVPTTNKILKYIQQEPVDLALYFRENDLQVLEFMNDSFIGNCRLKLLYSTSLYFEIRTIFQSFGIDPEKLGKFTKIEATYFPTDTGEVIPLKNIKYREINRTHSEVFLSDILSKKLKDLYKELIYCSENMEKETEFQLFFTKAQAIQEMLNEEVMFVGKRIRNYGDHPTVSQNPEKSLLLRYLEESDYVGSLAKEAFDEVNNLLKLANLKELEKHICLKIKKGLEKEIEKAVYKTTDIRELIKIHELFKESNNNYFESNFVSLLFPDEKELYLKKIEEIEKNINLTRKQKDKKISQLNSSFEITLVMSIDFKKKQLNIERIGVNNPFPIIPIKLRK